MSKNVNEVENEGRTTRDVLLAMGCVELKGRRSITYYWLDSVLIARICTTCQLIKLREVFHKDKSGYGGISNKCKKCTKEKDAKYYGLQNDRILVQKREYRKKYPDKVRSSFLRHYEKNSDAIKAKSRAYKKSHPIAVRLEKQKRRTLIRSLPSAMTQQQLCSILTKFHKTCALTSSLDTNLDHVIPIAIGHGGTIYGNIVPLDASLNKSKGDKHIFEWFDANKERFGLEQRKFDELIEYLAQVNGMTTQEYRAYVDWCFDNPRDINEMEATG